MVVAMVDIMGISSSGHKSSLKKIVPFLVIFHFCFLQIECFNFKPISHSRSRVSQVEYSRLNKFNNFPSPKISFKSQPLVQGHFGFPSNELLQAIPDVLFDGDIIDDLVKAKATVLESLSVDAFIFLLTVITVVPISGFLNVSPILGFLLMGVILGPSGLEYLRDMKDFTIFGELGILFLLFEQGLELSTARLKSLSKYAFGLGLQQVLFCTIAFGVFPFLGGVGILENIFQAPDNIVGITRVDEAFVIGVALALSSSAFVLKTLQEKGDMGNKFAKACLGVLLFQDIAIVPVLVLLPILETEQINLVDFGPQLQLIAVGLLKSIFGLGAILAVGKYLWKQLFQFVASAQSNETFTALVLLVAIGTGIATEEIGLSSTLGAFIAGVLLAETNFSTQIEADIKPFRGIFLALFFLNTGASIDPGFLLQYAPTVGALVFGLIFFKTAIVSALGPFWGLTFPESVKTAFVLSGGGEFAFVVLTLAEKLGVIPETLGRILVGVVVISMALTPALYALGDSAEKTLKEKYFTDLPEVEENPSFEGEDVIVLCGFGTVGQVISTYFLSPEISMELGASLVAFDSDLKKVTKGQQKGYKVVYGDGSEPAILEAAKIENPKAVVVTYTRIEKSLEAVTKLRAKYPTTPIFALGQDFAHYWNLKKAGATRVASTVGEMSIGLGSQVLEEFGLNKAESQRVKRTLRAALADLGKEGAIDDRPAPRILTENPADFVTLVNGDRGEMGKKDDVSDVEKVENEPLKAKADKS